MRYSTEYLLDKIAWQKRAIQHLKATLEAERAGRIAEIKADMLRMETRLNTEVK